MGRDSLCSIASGDILSHAHGHSKRAGLRHGVNASIFLISRAQGCPPRPCPGSLEDAKQCASRGGSSAGSTTLAMRSSSLWREASTCLFIFPRFLAPLKPWQWVCGPAAWNLSTSVVGAGQKKSVATMEVLAGSRGICLFKCHSIFSDPRQCRCLRRAAASSVLEVTGYQRHDMLALLGGRGVLYAGRRLRHKPINNRSAQVSG